MDSKPRPRHVSLVRRTCHRNPCRPPRPGARRDVYRSTVEKYKVVMTTFVSEAPGSTGSKVGGVGVGGGSQAGSQGQPWVFVTRDGGYMASPSRPSVWCERCYKLMYFLRHNCSPAPGLNAGQPNGKRSRLCFVFYLGRRLFDKGVWTIGCMKRARQGRAEFQTLAGFDTS